MKLVFYKDRKGEWRWRWRARNGRIMADSGEGYSSKRKAMKAVVRFFEMASETKWKVEVVDE
jgi:uncharacterized protein YegP (UPF0339 family)